MLNSPQTPQVLITCWEVFTLRTIRHPRFLFRALPTEQPSVCRFLILLLEIQVELPQFATALETASDTEPSAG